VHVPAQYVAGDRPLSAGFYSRLRHRHASREAQLRGLQSDVDANRNPVLVTGDFNSTLAMRDLRRLSRRLANANHAARRLYPSSWPARGAALWQLDWTFTSGVEVHRYDLLDPRGMSDHRVQALLVSIEGVTR
jgi:endonuclease/exonuclease/phosphatase (EEP) superfamily protein YafD